MTLESHKNLGGVGALLVVLSPIAMGAAAGVLGLVGLVLLLIALSGMARDFREKKIFSNALYGFVIAVVGVVVALVIVILTALRFFSQVGIDILNPNWTGMGRMFMGVLTPGFWPFLAGIVAALAVIFVCFLIAVIYFRRTLNILSDKTNVQLFATAGTIMLIGAILTIVVVGFLLIWISFILLTAAFFSIKTK
ncbi:MAG: DUF996 domain-containing protein [Candidatus Hadarchaeum sp.]|uniref:DUF996 domain-containing protein n=1 Tax=Candidatus Hadarchaeum sp. TaxID=2883567 RepID=UPI00316D3EA0